jgi:hypothetical protein
MPRTIFPLVLALATLVAIRASATPVINEIMYHPAGIPENRAQEWVEIYNDSAATTFDLTGWQFSKGVNFAFPNSTSLAPGSYLVVAADVAAFQAAHPGFAGQVVGGWVGTLANSGEQLQLNDALGVKIDEVHYADEGEWAVRGRGPLVVFAGGVEHRGWDWFTDADGGGKTLELRNPALAPFDCGQNWGVSAAVGGSPGAVNSVASANIAPLIKDVKHKPDVPHTTDPIVVSCNLHNEGGGATATLFWRKDGTVPFNSAPMTDTDGDGDVEATIPAQTTNLTIIEYYISATDGTNSRTWPAPARTSDIGVVPETFGQVTNALVLVDNSFDANAQFQAAGAQPIYRLIMTAAEKAELLQIQTILAQSQSEAAMNATFISHDGTGVKVRYLIGIRNRGTGSRLGPPNNYNLGFRNDELWEDRGALQINCRYPHSQVLGALCFELAGIAPQESAAVRVRVNGVDLAETGLRMYGRYARNETMSGDWAKRHFPNDPDGNVYFLDDHDTGGTNPPGDLGSGEFRYEGTNPLAYSDTYIKKTNEDINDYSDLITFTDKLTNTPDATYPATIEQYFDLDQFYTFIATDALIGNQEGGLQTGRADDVGLYRGLVDTRFRMIPHDFDSVFAFGLNAQDPGGPGGGGGFGDPYVRSIFSYDGEAPTSGGDGVQGLHKLFSHPALVPRYYAKLLEQMDKWYNHATLDPLIDRVLGGWVAAAGTNVSVASAKAYITARTANVLSQIQQNYAFTATGNAADVNGLKQTTNGAATFSGTFNVAKTYSITVNGTLATMFQRTVGADPAGTWRFVATAGSGFLKPGINRVTANFYDGLNGTGNVLTTKFVDVYYSGGGQVGIGANGVPQIGSVGLIAPDSYVPGVPVMVRVDLRDALGAYDRTAWNTTASLTATNGVTLTPNTVTLYNGVGSALVSAGGGGGGGSQTLFSFGTGGNGTTGSGIAGSQWKEKSDFNTTTLATFITNFGTTWKNEGFNDSTWTTVSTQAGYGNNDENTFIADLDYDATTVPASENVPCYLFRSTFTIADVNVLASITGQIKYDDAYAIYVNGQDINQRSANLPAGTALSAYSGTSADNATAAVTIPLAALHNGVNTIAIEVHQGNDTSSDVTFDLQLQANLLAANPGNFTLTATANGVSNAKTLTSLNGVAQTNVSGSLAGSNTWSGIIHVTGDVTVPAGASLTIQPGTHVLIDGTATAGDTTGKKITIAGTLTAPGTLASPISITSFDPTARWGQIVINAAQPTALDYCLISHAAHAPTGGPNHTNKGPMFLVNGSNVTLRDCVWGESPGKAMISSGTCDITIQRSLITHTITGPELQNGISLLCEDTNIQEILPTFRESNDLVPDDEDCLYIDNPAARSVLVNRCVFAKCGDDVMDNLGGPITVQDSILRQGWDKGVSLLDNNLTILRTQIIDCDKGISFKSRNPGTLTVTADHVTISSEEHDTTTAPWGYPVAPSAGDPDAPATGLWTQNKIGQSNTSAVLRYIVSNSTIEGKIPINVDAPYPAANTTPTFTCTHDTDTAGAVAWPGTGNIEAVPLFVDAANKDFHLQTGSPCKNTGDPAAPLDADGSRTDMGALPFGTGSGGGGTPTNIVWATVNSPFHVTTDVTIPTGSTLTIEPGVTVFVDKNKHIVVNGKVNIVGTANRHITLSGVPGLPLEADPADPGLPMTTQKWGGLWIVNSMDPANIVSYVDFVDAQDVLSSGGNATSRGCIEMVESELTIDHCTFRGTHLHMIYGVHSSTTIQYCTFPDMFAASETPGALNNVAEHVKLTGKFPVGGHCIIRYNTFGGNKGHNDVVDVDSGTLPAAIVQIIGNVFNGQTGDEDCDMGGDAYLEGNIFSHGTKDQYNTSSAGYASAFSTGDVPGVSSDVVAVRNIFWDMDHATALKSLTGAIFEHNTAYKLHATFNDASGRPQRASVVTFVVPEEGSSPGDGAYLGNNIFWSLPNVLGQPDVGTGGNGTVTTKLQADYNELDPAIPTAAGVNHPGGFFSLGVNNFTGNPLMVDPDNGNFALAGDSPARGATLFGQDLGAVVPGGAWITGEPPAQTPSTSASLTVGGPGIFAYKWKLDNGAWSAAIPIDPAFPISFPRTAATKRTAQLALSGLTNGPHTVSVIGQNFAGAWQDEAAATISQAWTVNTALQLVQLNEIRADSATTQPDAIELYNAGANAVNIGGWSLSDDPLTPNKYVIPANTMLASGGFYFVTSTTSLINLDKDGDSVYLRNGATLVDAITFGHQVPDLTIGRIGQDGAWGLCQPTLGAANVRQRLGIAASVRINEWFTGGDVLYDNDWIELANTGPLPVSLGGLRLTDNRAGNASAGVLPPLSYIAANGFVKLITDGHPELGATHLNFSLDAQQEEISLLSANGTKLDTVFFYPQTSDYSQGRDANGNLVYYELPTANLANGTGDPGYANALALLRGLRITEIMFNAIGGSDYDYVELRNVGASMLQLGGVKFVEGIDYTFPAMTLNANATVIVCKNLTKFRARYGPGPVVAAGIYSGQLDNGGEILALQLPPPFDANILTFSYNDSWYASTDGLGTSLVVFDPLTKANVWGDRDTWRPSAENGGHPGGFTARSDTYSGWSALHGVLSVTADDDKDGVAALVEFGLGMDPAETNGGDGAAGAPFVTVNVSGNAELHLLVPASSAAQGHGMAEAVYNVQASSNLTAWTTIATKTFTTNWTGTVNYGGAVGGFVPVVVEDTVGGTQRYLRLQVVWAP